MSLVRVEAVKSAFRSVLQVLSMLLLSGPHSGWWAFRGEPVLRKTRVYTDVHEDVSGGKMETGT